jgi:hypothetical protein
MQLHAMTLDCLWNTFIYSLTYIYCMDNEANNDEGENVDWHLYDDSDKSKI